MGPDWQALQDHIRAARAQRGWSQADLADMAGVSLKTVSDLETKTFKRMPNKAASIETALGWEPGTARRVVFDGYRPPVRERHGDPRIEAILLAVEPGATPEQMDEIRRSLEGSHALTPEVIRRAKAHLLRTAESDEEAAELLRRFEQAEDRSRHNGDDERKAL